MLLQQVLNGLTIGAIYAIIALGLTLVYGVLRILHVAHAGIYVLGGYVGWLVHAASGSLALALLAAMAASALAGLLVERWLYLPLLGRPRIVPLIASIGLFIALPVVLWELWRFVVPGLTRRERRLAILFVTSSVVLFLMGAVLAYVTLPKALNFLLGFAGSRFVPLLTGDRFISFVMLVALAFGLSFEFPIVLVFLTVLGVVTTDQLRAWRRWAILGISIFAAFITPSADPYTMLAMMFPMMLFYEAAIIVARALGK